MGKHVTIHSVAMIPRTRYFVLRDIYCEAKCRYAIKKGYKEEGAIRKLLLIRKGVRISAKRCASITSHMSEVTKKCYCREGAGWL